jgi:hypothetical protein
MVLVVRSVVSMSHFEGLQIMDAKKTSRVLRCAFRKKTGRLPSADVLQLLWTVFLGRLQKAEDNEQKTGLPVQIKLVTWRAVLDTRSMLLEAEMIREREADSINTWGTLRQQGWKSLPTNRRWRTAPEQELWETIVDFESVCGLSPDSEHSDVEF